MCLFRSGTDVVGEGEDASSTLGKKQFIHTIFKDTILTTNKTDFYLNKPLIYCLYFTINVVIRVWY